MARIRIEDEGIKTWEDADEVLKEIASLDIAVADIEGEMNVRLNQIKEEAKMKSKIHKDRIKELEKELKSFVTVHRTEIDGKTKNLNFGKTGFRMSTSVSVPTAKDKLKIIIEALRIRKMDDCIKVTEKVDKDTLKKYDEKVITEVGCTLKKKDVFWYEPDHEKIK